MQKRRLLTPHFPSVKFETLGCKLNFAESATISHSLQEKGFRVSQEEYGADYFIINSCSVTENADQKCRKLVKDFKKKSPESKIIIIGCYAQLKPQEIEEIEGVDLVLGASEKFKLVNFLEAFEQNTPLTARRASTLEILEFNSSYSLGERTRSFLKVQDGCDYSCSFCTIPLARGQSRNASVRDTLKKAQYLADQGFREIVLTGVNIGDFGGSTGETFLDLLQELDKIDTIGRIRLSSIEPNLLSSEIIRFIAKSARFMPHFHIPLQSGSNKILGLMRRRYKVEAYEDKIQEINELIPLAGIGVDVIVGFPGETEKEFQETFQFLERIKISYLHVFSYSERANTLATSLDGKVSSEIRSARSRKLQELSTRKIQEFAQRNVGYIYPVLFEKAPINGFMHGFTPNYIRIEKAYNPLISGTVLPTLVHEFNSILKSLS